MATFKYFSDIDGETTELRTISSMKNAEFAARFPGVKGRRSDSFEMLVGRVIGGEWLPVTRTIEYKSQPSRHECSAKCLGGKATGTCECKCGGKNHGAGIFSRLLEAA